MRKYEKMREKKAQSVLNNYSPKLQKVMETLPFDKISPPFMFSGQAMIGNTVSSPRLSGQPSKKMLKEQ